jgi:signal transduction histidine kinase
MIAMLGISIISVAAHVTYQTIKEMDDSTPQPNVILRFPLKQNEKPSDPNVKKNPSLSIIQSPPKDDSIPLWISAVIGGYFVLIMVCSTLIAVVVGNMIIRPLNTLAKAIDSIDPRDVLPMIKDDQNFETRETVRLINTLAEKVKSAMESRMRLVAAAGHDLRTPLTRMRIRAEFIEDEKQRETWIRDIDELTNIANSAITLVKEKTSSEELKDIQLDAFTASLVSELKSIGHDVSLGQIQSVVVKGREIALKRAFTNLLVNAATYGKRARIEILNQTDQAIIRITDVGPGIPDDMIGRAFEPFFRANTARQKNSNGAGLGLAIVKDIITSHNGTITLSNLKEGGLLQEIILPADH